MRLTETQTLQKYLPPTAVEPIIKMLGRYRIVLKISRERISKNGDFRPGINGQRHKISVNGNLNQYEFLMVFFHELAHLIVFEKYRGQKMTSHGKEWKQQYGILLREAADQGFFHPAITQLMHKYSYSVKATGIADLELTKALRAFDKPNGKPSLQLLDELPEGSVFNTKNGRTFIKGARVKKRYLCTCAITKKSYIVHPMLEVTLHPKPTENKHL